LVARARVELRDAVAREFSETGEETW